MGTTHSVEELESLGAYGSHKRPRTLSRGSSVDGGGRNGAYVVVKPRLVDIDRPDRKVNAPSGGYSTNGDQRSDDEVASSGRTSVTADPVKGEAEGQDGSSKDATRPVAAALLENPMPHRSRQRPRNPETKPPAPDELRRLMEQSKAMKEELEAEEPTERPIVEAPNENDVLLGRGRRCTEHHGNVLFREFVRERREEYNKAWKYKKQEMAVEIVDKIKALDPPGRFLELLNDGRWREVTKKQALEKASQAMREKKWSLERGSSTTPPRRIPRKEVATVERPLISLLQAPPASQVDAGEGQESQRNLEALESDVSLEWTRLHKEGATYFPPQQDATSTYPHAGAAQL